MTKKEKSMPMMTRTTKTSLMTLMIYWTRDTTNYRLICPLFSSIISVFSKAVFIAYVPHQRHAMKIIYLAILQ